MATDNTIPVSEAPETFELITATAKPGTKGVLGGDFRNMEIAMLMQAAQDEDEAVALLLMQ